jgi:hypothetical protein
MKHVIFVALLLLSAGKLIAGYDISICDSIDKKGLCQGKNDLFHFTGDKMKLQVLVHNKDMLGTSKISYKLYLMKNDHDGEISAELSSSVKPEWFAAVKKLYFFKPGYYKLDIFKADKSKIGSVFFTLSDR